MGTNETVMIPSTLAFIYTPDFSEVLLITKHKPVFHKGLLNGLGGKCKTGETPIACVQREIKEESNLDIAESKWKSLGLLSWTEWEVTVFAAVYSGAKTDVKSLTEDAVSWYPVTQLPVNIISNLSWLVPLAVDVLTQKTPPTITVEYPD